MAPSPLERPYQGTPPRLHFKGWDTYLPSFLTSCVLTWEPGGEQCREAGEGLDSGPCVLKSSNCLSDSGRVMAGVPRCGVLSVPPCARTEELCESWPALAFDHLGRGGDLFPAQVTFWDSAPCWSVPAVQFPILGPLVYRPDWLRRLRKRASQGTGSPLFLRLQKHQKE